MNKYIFFFVLLFSSFFSISQDIIDSIPFNYDYGFLIIKGKINEKTYDFLFDTGARTSITDEVIDDLKIKPISYEPFNKYLVNVSLSDKVLEPRIKIKKIHFYLAKIANGGIIGRDFFKNKIFKIDYKQKKIYFLRRKTKNKNSLAFIWNAYTSPYTEMLIGKIKVKITLDTGYSSMSGLGLSLSKETFEHFYINKYSLKQFKKFSILKNDTLNKKYFESDVQIGDVFIQNYKIGIQSTYPENLLGNYFFQDYVVIFDFINNQFYFE